MANGPSEELNRSPCVLGNDNRRRISTVEKEMEEVKREYQVADREIKDEFHASESEQWTAINNLRDRLPPWATFIIAGLAAIASAAVTVAIAVAF
jgi:hypothetical protein